MSRQTQESIQAQEYHLLHVINSKGDRTYYLNAAAVSIGRDSSSAVMVSDPMVSRHHAMLLRVPTEDCGYSYELVDGDVHGRPSRNGMRINRRRCERKILTTGDRITVGNTSMSYMIASMTPAEYAEFFDAQPVSFHSLKEEILDPTGTLMGEDFTIAA
ncbi:MAG: FHA domain-containing protein [Cyanobacteria bacterium P01_F01_bin.42]